MVTFNLLPKTRQVRLPKHTRWLLVSPAPVLLLLCFLLLAHKGNITPTPAPTPESRVPFEPDRTALARMDTARLLQAFTRVSERLGALHIPPLHLQRLQLQSGGPILLEGETPAPAPWLTLLSSLPQRWHPAVKSFQPITPRGGMRFTVTLHPPLKTVNLSSGGAWHPLQNPASVLHYLLGSSHGTLTLTRLQLPENEDKMAELQATGSRSALAALAQRMLQTGFFCPLHTLRLTDWDKTPVLLLKWHFPCFRLHPETDLPLFLRTLRLAGWLRNSKETFVLLETGAEGLLKLALNDVVPRTDARIIRFWPDAVLLRTGKLCACVTQHGIQEVSRPCSAA